MKKTIEQPKDNTNVEQFTGGDWWQEINNNDYIDINGDDGFRICSLDAKEGDLAEVERTVEEQKANANLICAAPAMYRALKELMSDIQMLLLPTQELPPSYEKCKSILKKATPKQ